MKVGRALLKVGLACGLLAVIAFSSLYLVAVSQDPEYTFMENYLSDLGVGPGAWAFNSALMLSGALIVAFSLLGIHPSIGRSVPSRAGSALLAVAGVLLVNVGVFTEDYGDTHYVFSVAFFLTLLAALGALSFALWRTGALGRTGTASTVSAFVFGLVLLAAGIGPATETLAVLAALAWGSLMSALFILKARASPSCPS